MTRARKRFDWQKIHAELEGRLSHLGRSAEDDADRMREVMRQRSIALAAVPRQRHTLAERRRAIVFRLAGERYGLDLEHAREVTGLSHCATLPGAGRGIRGVVGWRGEFVVVFDLAAMLGLAAAEDQTTGRRIIVLRGEEPRMAILVDAIDQIVQVETSALQAPGEFQARHGDLFKGATPDAVVMLSENALLARLGEELQAA